ncbi:MULTISPECIES: chemotaxis protein CheB [unclassified Amycolatopsis]|uniref:chemotaxis protein CheB n=1 Tax=unclassified Amycolatopsis TaxID=2618356 RepID=UPI0028755F82|nr:MULTISPECIES: chemotaxis protein CheB [unclassified Amycolatopsis]MDS0134426.1 chemotaxis protein CheB [Amycolatopsis sp. 505]MDS0147774.1 chemotaxis protein CheB [Amycolatopsis sp. CM201R]
MGAVPPFRRDLVVVGASAGGVEVLRTVVSALPPDFPAAVLVTMHLSAGTQSALARILDRAGPLPAREARHGAPIEPGTVSVAPPDRHLLTGDGILVLTQGPTENGHRPAINATFRSAALTGGPRAIGVVLSGVLDDGAAGLRAIADRGGVAVVQDPADALYSGMPENALAQVDTEHVVRAGELGALLDKLVRMPVEAAELPPPPVSLLLEDRIAREAVRAGALPDAERDDGSGYTCPDCQGSLTEVDPGRYRCRIGHAWSAQALLAAHDGEFRFALQKALRALDEKAGLARKLAAQLSGRHPGGLSDRYAASAREAAQAAETLRRFLLETTDGAGEETAAP